MVTRFGGSFAPPLTAEKVQEYRGLAEKAEPQVKEIMLNLCDMVETFLETPASTQPGTPHRSGRGTIIPLEEKEVKRIWDKVPWPEECQMYGQVLERLPSGTQELGTVQVSENQRIQRPKIVITDPETKKIRDAAFHLLWYANELTLDREPMTSDK